MFICLSSICLVNDIKDFFFMKECCSNKFYSIDKVSKVPCRTLICHGMNDVIVSINHSIALQSRLPNATKPFFLDKATHQVKYCLHFYSISIPKSNTLLYFRKN